MMVAEVSPSSSSKQYYYSTENPTELPSTAQEVRILNVLNPFFIAVSNIDHCAERSKKISQKLHALIKNTDKNVTGPAEIGMTVIIEGQVGERIELPAWWCRGTITGINSATSVYEILLQDYGTIVSLLRHQFTIIPEDSIPDDYLTYPICLYNILPGILNTSTTHNKKKKKYKMMIKNDWSSDAINLTKDLISSSERSYFDHLAESNRQKYGEMYLIIDDQVVPLRKILVHSRYAIYVNEQLCQELQSLHSPSTDSTSDDNNTFVITKAPLLAPDDSSASPGIPALPERAQGQHYGEIFVSSAKQCKRLAAINDAMFAPSIHKALEAADIKHLWKIPSYTWPAISKLLDTLIIGRRSTGKTVGYAAPIANIIMTTRDQQEDNYPMALILSSSTNDVQYIHDTFHKLLDKEPDIKIVSAYNGITYRSLIAKLYNGCHIFISTAAFLDRFFEDKEHRKILNFNYIRHMIFDGLDVIWAKQKNSLMRIIGETPLGRRKFQNAKKFTVQMIAVAERWSMSFGKFIKVFSDPFICIGSYPDAVISCGVQPKLRQITRAQKPGEIIKIVKDHCRVVKTLIICSTRKEASRLNYYLSKHYKILYVNEKCQIAEIYGMKKSWEAAISGDYPILLCTDEALHDLRISDAEWLIHYSIATPTKSIFYFRFSTLMANLNEKNKKLEVTIIIDETNDVQLHGVLDLMERSGVELSNDQLEVAAKIMSALDRRKGNYSLCNMVKAFGSCQKLGKCPYRHCVLPDVDEPMIPVQRGDQVRLILTYVHTATHFSGRIIERRDERGVVHKMHEEGHYEITSLVHSYYAINKNRITSRDIVVGGIYGYNCSQYHFERVKVIHIDESSIDDRPLYVDVKCIDTGMIFNHIRVSGLLEMPERLAKAPAHIVEIFLANILPFDNEETWSSPATDCSYQWLNDNRSQDKFLQAKILLILGNSVWVDRMDIKMRIIGRQDQHCASLKEHLIKRHHGISNDTHMKKLWKLCKISDEFQIDK